MKRPPDPPRKFAEGERVRVAAAPGYVHNGILGTVTAASTAWPDEYEVRVDPSPGFPQGCTHDFDYDELVPAESEGEERLRNGE